MNHRNLSRELLGKASGSLSPAPAPEESLVADDRGGLSPSQMVDHRLAFLLQRAALPVQPADRPDPPPEAPVARAASEVWAGLLLRTAATKESARASSR